MRRKRLSLLVSEEAYRSLCRRSLATGTSPSQLVEGFVMTLDVPRPSSERPGFVYFVSDLDGKAIKVGYSDDPVRRLSSIQTGNSSRLTLIATMPGTLATERALHERFAYGKGLGEWFEPDKPLLDYIDDHADVRDRAAFDGLCSIHC